MKAPIKQRILTTNERNDLRAQLGCGPISIEASDVATGNVWYQAPHNQHLDPIQLAIKRQRIQAAIDAGSPHDEKKQYRAWRDRRIGELETSLRKDTIPRSFYHLKRADSKDYDKVRDEVVSQLENPRRRALEDELKNLRRERDPENPNAGKITDLREEKEIKA